MVRTRKERDSLGIVKVPSDAYYGAQTQRAFENFPISGINVSPLFIKNYVIIKKAAARVNLKLKKLEKREAIAIIKACDKLIQGKYAKEFVVDVYQAGGGTSTNMNVNEVIANIANEILLGKKAKKGKYEIIHPNDHVNMSQSTNDTYHVCIHLTVKELMESLIPELEKLEKEFGKKAKQFSKIIKVGRTHLQDAVPITLGEEFSGYSSTLSKNRKEIERSSESLKEIIIGGTALGTGLNASPKFSNLIIKELSKLTKTKYRKSKNRFSDYQSMRAGAKVSESLKLLAIDLSKICSDLILLSSGPNTGFNEIILPPVQPGSSIMPGKINPSMIEMTNMVCFQVIGNNLTVSEAIRSGQLELNVYMPIISFNLIESTQILTSTIKALREKAIKGIKANKIKISMYLEKNAIIATSLTPYIGYDKTAKIIKEAYKTNKPIKEVALKRSGLTKKELDKILDPRKLV